LRAALDPDRRQFGDVVFDRGLVAPGPAGNDKSAHLDAARRAANHEFHAVSHSLCDRLFLQGLKVCFPASSE